MGQILGQIRKALCCQINHDKECAAARFWGHRPNSRTKISQMTERKLAKWVNKNRPNGGI